MGFTQTSERFTAMLAQLMRAEAELGMLMVGNISVNHVRADCLDFQDTFFD